MAPAFTCIYSQYGRGSGATTAGRRQGSVLINDASGNTLLSVSLDGPGDGSEAGFGPGTFSIFAGRGAGGGIAGPATSARVGAPTGMAEDGSDRIGYNTFTQVGNGMQGYNGDGELNTSAELNRPMGLDMDAANYIYVADGGNHIIRKTF